MVTQCKSKPRLTFLFIKFINRSSANFLKPELLKSTLHFSFPLKTMTRGYSLKQDLRLLINNPKYSDIEILCGDGKKLHACRAILAARSEVLERLLYNGMKESYENQITFP